MSGLETKVLNPGTVADPLTYEEAKHLARHQDPKVRQALAARRDLGPEILYFLSEDPSAQVRQAAAANTTTPGKANLKLAGDADEAVRTDLARKVATVVTELGADERDNLRNTTHEALEILARDQITRVRQILSETLKDVADAPPDVIKTLALDTELAVAGPVLEFSPVLTDDDLLELIGSGPAHGGLAAISRRAEVRATVAEAVASTADADAMREMGDFFKAKLTSVVVVLAAVVNGSPMLVAMATPDLVERGIHAGNLVRDAAKLMGGGGGGSPEMAQAGGKNVEKLDEALKSVPELVRQSLS